MHATGYVRQGKRDKRQVGTFSKQVMDENVLKDTSHWRKFFPKMWPGGAKIKKHSADNAVARAEITAWWCGGAKILKVAQVAVGRTKKRGARPALAFPKFCLLQNLPSAPPTSHSK